jgi:hypothetical protein
MTNASALAIAYNRTRNGRNSDEASGIEQGLAGSRYAATLVGKDHAEGSTTIRWRVRFGCYHSDLAYRLNNRGAGDVKLENPDRAISLVRRV